MATVLLSASFPSGERGASFAPYDASQIADACVYIARALLRAEHRIVFGAHPTISPLLLSIAAEMDIDQRLEIFQSEWFAGVIPAATEQLAELGHGQLVLTPAAESREASLTTMRAQMCATADAAVFIGGMEGILEEAQLTTARGIPSFAVWAPGGAARGLVNGPLGSAITPLLGTKYPELAASVVDALRAI